MLPPITPISYPFGEQGQPHAIVLSAISSVDPDRLGRKQLGLTKQDMGRLGDPEEKDLS